MPSNSCSYLLTKHNNYTQKIRGSWFEFFALRFESSSIANLSGFGIRFVFEQTDIFRIRPVSEVMRDGLIYDRAVKPPPITRPLPPKFLIAFMRTERAVTDGMKGMFTRTAALIALRF